MSTGRWPTPVGTRKRPPNCSESASQPSIENSREKWEVSSPFVRTSVEARLSRRVGPDNFPLSPSERVSLECPCGHRQLPYHGRGGLSVGLDSDWVPRGAGSWSGHTHRWKRKHRRHQRAPDAGQTRGLLCSLD